MENNKLEVKESVSEIEEKLEEMQAGSESETLTNFRATEELRNEWFFNIFNNMNSIVCSLLDSSHLENTDINESETIEKLCSIAYAVVMQNLSYLICDTEKLSKDNFVECIDLVSRHAKYNSHRSINRYKKMGFPEKKSEILEVGKVKD